MPKALVLVYHRIDSLEVDPWHLSVEPYHFHQHLEVIKQFGTILSSTELYSALLQKKITDRSVVITFDDGYRDNYSNAFPLLQKHQLPATFFITTNRLGKANGYWWDELENMIIHSKTLPQILSISLHKINIDFDLKDETVLSADKKNALKKWNVWKGVESKRADLYSMLQKGLQSLSYQEQQEILAYLRKWSGSEYNSSKNTVMNEEEVLQLSTSPLVTIGGHTTSHADLSYHNNDYQEAEIAGNKKNLEHLLNKKIDFFAYPYGRFNSSTPGLVAKSGYKAAFTTLGWVTRNHSNPYLLNRLHVKNWSGEELLQMLNHFFYKPYK